MDNDPRLTGSLPGPKSALFGGAGGGGGGVGSSSSSSGGGSGGGGGGGADIIIHNSPLSTPTLNTHNHPLQPHPGGSIGPGRPPPNLAPIQRAPSILTTPSPCSSSTATASQSQSQSQPQLQSQPQSHGLPSSSASSSSALLLDQKRPRACESCRGLKVRCEPNEQNPLATCKRCAKANRQCVFTAPSRKRQKKSDSKVAELEKRIDALTASLRAQQARVAAHGGDDEDDDEDYMDDGDTPGSSDMLRPDVSGSEFSSMPRGVKRPRVEDTDATYAFPALKGGKVPTTTHMRPLDEEAHKFIHIDVVDRNLLSMETATHIFNRYVEDLTPHFPAVVFSPGTTAEDVRRTKPTLFLAILAAASGGSYPDLHRTLYKEICRAFAERIMINGEKSLELVQALILCTMWYFVPDHYEELKFYMNIHLAAVMALDIGITKKRKLNRGSLRKLPPEPIMPSGPGDRRNQGGNNVPSTPHPHSGGEGEEEKHPLPKPLPPPPPMLKMPFPDPEAIESRRTLLACYWACSNTSMAQRRPNLLRYTDFMNECIGVLETSPEAAPTDVILCQWVKLQKIAEEVGIGFAFDDPNANVSIDEARVQFSLKGFARQLEEWKARCPPAAFNQSLELAYHLIVIYAHEISLHRDHNVDDFQPPFNESMMREPSLRPNDLLSSFHIDAISRCLSSAHKVLQTFMNLHTNQIRSVPVFTFVRTSYACIILIKLYFSASHPLSELGKVIDKNSLKVDEYLDQLLDTLRKAAANGLSRQAQKFTMMFMVMRHWYSKQKAEIEKGSNTALEPFKKLELGEKKTQQQQQQQQRTPNSDGMEGMETPHSNSSMDDFSSTATDTPENMDQYYDAPMRLPPPSKSRAAATPLQMLSNAALSPHSSNSGRQQQQYASPSTMGMATPRSSPNPQTQTPYVGKWADGMYQVQQQQQQQGDSLGVPGMVGMGCMGVHGMQHTGQHQHQHQHHGGVAGGGGEREGEGGKGSNSQHGESNMEAMMGEVLSGEIDYNIVPQYLFTGNGEMFMDDTFWAMMDGSSDFGGKY